jgi:crotonobetainyl-CoA:carnitine CoA-transferase CaiB-like acyl-CoA transferase
MEKALNGLKILDFTRVYSGPYCTMLLADMGADVIKIEARGLGDDTRFFKPVKNGVSGYFTYLNRSKRSVELNLKSEAGKAAALDLARWADVVVENFSPGAMGRLGLDYEAVRRINPEVVYASISGFGQTGPYRNRVAYDGVVQAMAGLVWLTGYPDALPVKAGPAISDAATGVHAALGIMMALYYKGATGKGQYIDMGMMDTMFSMLENAVPIKLFLDEEPMRLGNGNPGSAPYNMYPTRDGHIVIATANNVLFTKLVKVMGREDLLDMPEFRENFMRKGNEKQMDAIMEAWTRQYTSRELELRLTEAGVPVAHVFSLGELVEDPHLAARDMLVEQDVPGVGRTIFPGNPIKLQATPPDPSLRAPLLGEHTEQVLRDVLGYAPERIEAVRAAGS